jgi:hypothetical protein
LKPNSSVTPVGGVQRSVGVGTVGVLINWIVYRIKSSNDGPTDSSPSNGAGAMRTGAGRRGALRLIGLRGRGFRARVRAGCFFRCFLVGFRGRRLGFRAFPLRFATMLQSVTRKTLICQALTVHLNSCSKTRVCGIFNGRRKGYGGHVEI